MNLRFLAFCALCCTLGLGVGMFAPRLWKELTPQELSIDLPKEGVKSDAFSLRLFQQELKTRERDGVVVVAPAFLTAVLHVLRESSAGQTKEQLEALALTSDDFSTEHGTAIWAMDARIPRTENADWIEPLPFRDDYPTALSLFNTLLGSGAGSFGSHIIPPETRFTCAYTVDYTPKWEYSLFKTTQTAPFHNANGRMPEQRLLQAEGKLRVAEAGDGSWKAFALLIRESDNTPLFMVCIIPKDNARKFAADLTTETLNSIRTALAEAAPQEGCALLPHLRLHAGPRSETETLSELGSKALFDIRHADFSPISPEKICLNGLWGKLSLLLENNGTAKEANPQPLLTLDKPFIWFIGAPTESKPPELMGLVENL